MSDPDLLHADRRSLIGAVTRAAQDGLLPDKREGALVIFNQKVKVNGNEEWIKAVQWMPMIAGVLKKVRQSGEIAAISANIIHENDQFTWSLGDEEAIEHVPPQLGAERGKPIGVYAIATLKDGYKIREVMDINEIEKVRKVSKTGTYGPWKDWWEEMAKKTVIRRLSKRLPMSTDIEGVINDEATEADFSRSTMTALEDATDILFDCVVDDKEFLAEKMPQILRAWCYEQISSHVSRIRTTSWTAPNYQKQSKSERIRLAFSDKLMDFPLIGGKRLGDASKDEVQASAATYLEQASTLAHRGRWLIAVSKKLNANTTVSQALTEAELRELKEKTNAS